MSGGFFGAESGLGADGEFIEFGFGEEIAWGEDGAEVSGEEAEGDADDAGIFEGERGRFGIIEAIFAEENEGDGGEEPDGEAGDGAGGIEAFPEDGEEDHGEIGGSGHGESEADEHGGVDTGAEFDGDGDAGGADDESGDAGDEDLATGLGFAAFVDDIDIEIVSERSAGGHGEAGDHGEDGGEGDGGDEGEEHVAAEDTGEDGGDHIAVGEAFGVEGEVFDFEEDSGAEAKESGHDVEHPDDGGGPDHADAGGFGIWDGVEADEDVGESGGAEDEAEGEGDEVPSAPRVGGGGAEFHAGVEEIDWGFGASVSGLGDGIEERAEAEIEFAEDHPTQGEGAAHEEDGFDDLDPSGGEHAAEDHVDEHEDPDADDGWGEGDADELFDDAAGADHLGDHIESGDHESGEGGHGANGSGVEAIGEEIRHGVFAGVAEGFGDEEEDGEIGDEEADGIHEAIVAFEADDAADAEERGGAHVIAGDGEAILPAFDGATGGEVSGGAGGFASGEISDDEREGDEGKEHA